MKSIPTNFMWNTSPHHLFSYSKFHFNCIQISKWQALFKTWQPLGSTFHPAMTRILSRMFSGSELDVTIRNRRFTGRLHGHDTLYCLSTHRSQIRTTKNTSHTPCMTGDLNQWFSGKQHHISFQEQTKCLEDKINCNLRLIQYLKNLVKHFIH